MILSSRKVINMNEIDFRADFQRRAEALQMNGEQYIRALGFSEGEFAELCGTARDAFSELVLSGDHEITVARFRFGYESRTGLPGFLENNSFTRRDNGVEQGIDSALRMIPTDSFHFVPETQIILPDQAFRQEMIQAFPDVVAQKRGIVTLATAVKESGMRDTQTFLTAMTQGINTYWDKSPRQSIAAI